MKKWNQTVGWGVQLLILGLMVLFSCDSGEKALEEVTGSRAVQQYHKTKKDAEKLRAREDERLKGVQEDDKEEGK